MKYLKIVTIITFGLLGCKNNEIKEQATENLSEEQAVIVYFQYGIEGLDSLNQLEAKIEQVLSKSDVDDYDGHEIAVDYSDGILYFYGKNADYLFNVIKPVLQSTSFMKNAEVKLRYGKVDSDAREVVLKI